MKNPNAHGGARRLLISSAASLLRAVILVSALALCASGGAPAQRAYAHPSPDAAQARSRDVEPSSDLASRNGAVGRASGFSVQVWRTDDGLPSDMVNAIAQSSDGYLWIATNAGLTRFDGVSFRVFDHTNTLELQSDDHLRLFQTRAGFLWIGSVGGFFTKLENGKFTSYGRPEGLTFRFPYGLVEARSGMQWFGTDDGLFVWDGKRFAHTDATGFPMLEDASGRLWMSGTQGFGVWDGRSLRALGTDTEALVREGSFLPPSVRWPFKLIPGQPGTVWIYQYEPSRVWRVRGGETSTYEMPSVLPAEILTFFYESRDGILWIGTTPSGLLYIQDGQVHRLSDGDKLPGERVTSITEDREGNIWIGTNAGMCRLRKRAFSMIGKDNGLVDERTWTVLEDRKGDIWTGTENGLHRLHGSQATTYRITDGLGGRGVVSLCEDRRGNLWIGTTNGLSCRTEDRFINYGKKDGLSDDNVRALFEDRKGRLWIGTANGGVNVLEDGRFRAWRAKDGLGSDWVRFIHEDAAGDIWLCTTRGLSRWRDGTITTYTTADGLTKDVVLGVHEEKDGTLWFGTFGGGLCKLKDGRFHAVTTADGLLDNTILRILDGGGEDLWISTPKGIFRVGRRALNDVADGRARHLAGVVYGKRDGLATTDCSGGTQPAGWRGRDGRLWFPTSRGVAVVDPARLAVNRVPPPVVIEQIVSDDQPIDAPSGATDITVPPGARSLEIHYAALSFSAPEKVRFRYRLEGYDPEWVEAGTRRVAYYTGLPPRSYRFHVVAANDDGVWNEAGARMNLRALPFFYQTWWFFGVCVALAATIIWRLYRLRLQRIEARFAAVLDERNRIARELHDTIALGFTGVSMQLEAVAAKLPDLPRETRESLDRARLLIRSSLADARRSVRALRPKALEKGDLTSSLRAALEESTAGTSVRGEFSVRGAGRRIPELIEDHLLRVGQEAVSNALRHGECSTIRIELSYHRRRVELVVEDDGRGISGATEGDPSPGGMGLTGMRERLAQIGGRLEVKSAPGHGTRVTAIAPMPGVRLWRRA